MAFEEIPGEVPFECSLFIGLDLEGSLSSSYPSIRRQSDASCLSSLDSDCSSMTPSDASDSIRCFESQGIEMSDFTTMTSMSHCSYADPLPYLMNEQMTIMSDEDMDFVLQEASMSKHKEEGSVGSPWHTGINNELQDQFPPQFGSTTTSFTRICPNYCQDLSRKERLAASTPFPDILSVESRPNHFSETVEPAQICPPSSPRSSFGDSWSTTTSFGDSWSNTTSQLDNRELEDVLLLQRRLDVRLIHHNIIQISSFECDELLQNGTKCSKTFKRQEHLKRHLNGVHNSEERFACIVCSRKSDPDEKGKATFNRNDNLTQHIIKTHLSGTAKKRNRRISDEEAKAIDWQCYLDKREEQKKAAYARQQAKQAGVAFRKGILRQPAAKKGTRKPSTRRKE